MLDTVVRCFWNRGYEATSVKTLVDATGITAASLYNAFGDKRALFQKALDRYIEASVANRIRRYEALPPREAISAFLGEIVARSLDDDEWKGCLVVNSALELAPHDPEFRAVVAGIVTRIELFFLDRVQAGQADGTVTRSLPADDIARHCLGIVMGVRVLARVRPERALLDGIVSTALALLDGARKGNAPA